MSAIEELKEALAASKKEWNLPEHRSGFPTVKVTEATAEAILAELERLQGGIELAIDCLPECPDKAKNFLEGALRPKACELCGDSGEVKQTCEECGKLSDEDCFSVCRFKPCPKCKPCATCGGLKIVCPEGLLNGGTAKACPECCPKPKPCEKCGGSGWEWRDHYGPDNKPDGEKCKACKGSGKDPNSGPYEPMDDTCSRCNGSGKENNDE